MKDREHRVVWLIDAEHWPRAALRAELIERGYDAIGFAAVDDAILCLAVQREGRPQLLIIDLAGQALTGSAFRLLTQGGVPSIGIAGAVEASGDSAHLAWTELLTRPVSLGQIADIADRLLRPLT